MTKKAGFRAVGLLATLALFVGMAFTAAVDFYLKIEGIPGESTAKGFEGQIEVESWSWGMSQAVTAQGREGTMLGDPTKPFIIAKPLDKASPKLAQALASKQHFPTVTLTLRRAGGDQQPYMRYVLKDCFITSIKPVAGDVPMEQVSFNYSKIEWTHIRGPKGMTPRTPMER